MDDWIRIAQAGGGFRLDATHRDPVELRQIATAAHTGGAMVVFAGIARHDTDDVMQIAMAGKGSVLCEDSKAMGEDLRIDPPKPPEGV
jgi:DNA replication protein